MSHLKSISNQNMKIIIQTPSDSSNVEPEKLALDNAYEPTPCSAHVTVATTCIDGNNQLETSSI
jgi:hypothetical protein